MTEGPILFSSSMVLAILGGRKTQTRRVIKPEWYRCLDLSDPVDIDKALARCPYGRNRLWVRETHAIEAHINDNARIVYRADGYARWFDDVPVGDPFYLPSDYKAKWRPSIHMPRWASRINLDIASLRLERLQNISDDDVMAEGASGTAPEDTFDSPREEFAHLWDSINSKRGYGWESNPFVWAVEWKPIIDGTEKK